MKASACCITCFCAQLCRFTFSKGLPKATKSVFNTKYEQYEADLTRCGSSGVSREGCNEFVHAKCGTCFLRKHLGVLAECLIQANCRVGLNPAKKGPLWQRQGVGDGRCLYIQRKQFKSS